MRCAKFNLTSLTFSGKFPEMYQPFATLLLLYLQKTDLTVPLYLQISQRCICAVKKAANEAWEQQKCAVLLDTITCYYSKNKSNDFELKTQTWVALTSSLLSAGMSLCLGVRGFPTSGWVTIVFFEFLMPDVANCSKASSNPVMELWIFDIFFCFFCFFFSMSSVKFGGLALGSCAGKEKWKNCVGFDHVHINLVPCLTEIVVLNVHVWRLWTCKGGGEESCLARTKRGGEVHIVEESVMRYSTLEPGDQVCCSLISDLADKRTCL